MDSIEAVKPGRPTVPNRQGLYAKAAKHAGLAINVLGDLLYSRNENIRLGAANAILNKCLPDLKAIAVKEEIIGGNQNKIYVNLGSGFVPKGI